MTLEISVQRYLEEVGAEMALTGRNTYSHANTPVDRRVGLCFRLKGLICQNGQRPGEARKQPYELPRRLRVEIEDIMRIESKTP